MKHVLWLDGKQRKLIEKCSEALERGAMSVEDVYMYVLPDQRFSPEEILACASEIFMKGDCDENS